MTDLRKAAEMALDALHNIDQSNNDDAIQALRQALAQPEQVLTARVVVTGEKRDGCFDLPNDIDAYERGVIDGMQKQMKSTVEKAVNAMTKREWVGLTRRELDIATLGLEDLSDCYMAIEAKLKEKNS